MKVFFVILEIVESISGNVANQDTTSTVSVTRQFGY